MMSTVAQQERHFEAAEGYLMLGMAERALAELGGVDDPSPHDRRWRRLNAESLRANEQYEEALEHFLAMLDDSEDDLEAAMGAAWCYKRTDRLSRAISTMRQIARVHDDEPIVLYNTACYYAVDGNREQALSYLGRALRMNSDLRRIIDDEPDFDSLRHDPMFQFIITGPSESPNSA